MNEKLTVRKDGKEYEVSPDGEGIVWLDNDEEVVSNPHNLRFHTPRADGKSQLEVNALAVAGFVAAIIVFCFIEVFQENPNIFSVWDELKMIEGNLSFNQE